MTLTSDLELFGTYAPRAGVYDELIDTGGGVREEWTYLVKAFEAMGVEGLADRRLEVDQQLRFDGVTHNIHGDPSGMHTPWELDPVPVVIRSAEWFEIERGIAQRAELLDLLLADIYGRRTLITRGSVAPELIYAHAGFLRASDGVMLPHERQLFSYAADLARDGDGRLVVVADRTQAPAGAGYALENRLVVSRVFPSVYRDAGVHRLAPFFRAVRAGLTQAAPIGVDDPRVVILTPGRWNESYFEHAYLATSLGYSLVEAADLTVQDGCVWLRSLGGLERVDVIVRRVDGNYCDPLELRADSQLGVPGLVDVARRGRVSIVNPIGSAVLENPALMPILPELCRALLGEDLLLPSAPTWWCGHEADRRYVLDHLGELVVKPISRGAGMATVAGWTLSAAQLDELRARIDARPHLFAGQALIPGSSTPTLTPTGVAPRTSVLRAFAAARSDDYIVLTGGLSRVAGDIDELLTASPMTMTSKDTWVIASEPEAQSAFWLQSGPVIDATDPASAMPSRAAENLFWLGRYAERAEGIIRLYRCIIDRRNDLAGGRNPAAHECVEGLLIALTQVTTTYPGFVGEGATERLADPDDELRAVLVDSTRAGSLMASLLSVLSTADAVRDQLSSDTWLVVSNLGHELRQLERRRSDLDTTARTILGGILKSLLALSGLGMESMVRDPGWQFLDAGRRIERASAVSALLRATVVPVRSTGAESLMFESVLRAAESIITYRRRYRSQAQLETLLDLLVLDRTNPRSISFQLDRLHEDVELLPRDASYRLAPDQRRVIDVRTRVRLADTATLARAGDDAVRWDLDHFLDAVTSLLADASKAIDAEHFTHLHAPLTVGLPSMSAGSLGSAPNPSEATP